MTKYLSNADPKPLILELLKDLWFYKSNQE